MASCESTRPTSNGVYVCDSELTGCPRRLTRPSDRRIETVSIGRHPVGRARAGERRETDRHALRKRELTKVRGSSHAVGRDDDAGGSGIRVSISALHRTPERHLVLCGSRDGERWRREGRADGRDRCRAGWWCGLTAPDEQERSPDEHDDDGGRGTHW